MTIQIHTNCSELKPRLLTIGKKYSNNAYYQDDRKLFSLLVILVEDFPENYATILDTDKNYILVKYWIDGLFEIKDVEIVKTFTTEDKVKLILNNITHLPHCKCNVKLRKLQTVSD